jgi:hypothetical protein
VHDQQQDHTLHGTAAIARIRACLAGDPDVTDVVLGHRFTKAIERAPGL